MTYLQYCVYLVYPIKRIIQKPYMILSFHSYFYVN